jgi:HEPN domain-containing protein
LTRLKAMQTLDEAIAMLRSKRLDVATGSYSVFEVIYNAERSLEAQLKSMLREDDTPKRPPQSVPAIAEEVRA